MRSSLTVLVTFALATVALAQSPPEVAVPAYRVPGVAGPPPFYPTGPALFQYLRYTEPPGEDWLRLGGDLRQRYEAYRHPGFGTAPAGDGGWNGSYLQRYMLHADARLGESGRVFGEFKSGLEDGRVGGPRPFDRDDADIHQLFADAILPLADDAAFTLRAGRQEMAYGGLRLVDVREGPNVRQSFDALRGILTWGDRRADVFLSKFVDTRPGAFDDTSNAGRTFWGTYLLGPLAALPDGHLEVYYFGLRNLRAAYEQGAGLEVRHTVGARVWGAPGPWDYNAEANGQWGHFAGLPIAAGTAVIDGGYTWLQRPWTPRLGVTVGWASGDRDAADGRLETYNALFPTALYFNRADDLIGPANFVEFHPKVFLYPTQTLRLALDWNLFWRATAGDGVYGFGVNLIRPSGGSAALQTGNALSAEFQWQATPNWALVGAYTRLFSGAFLDQTGPGRDVDFVTAFVAYRF